MKSNPCNAVFDSDTWMKITIITHTVEDSYGIPRGGIITRNRTRHYVEPRYMAMQLIKEFTTDYFNTVALSKIGYHFGNFDHATVSHAIRTVNNLIDTDKAFNLKYQEIKTTCNIEIVKKMRGN